MGYKLKRIMMRPNGVEKQVRPGNTVQTFDFQNDGNLNWTAQTLYGTPSLVSGEGWTIGNANSDNQSCITPPSSVYDGKTLRKVKIWMYKNAEQSYPHGAGTGILDSSGSHQGTIWSQARVVDYDRVYYWDGSSTNLMQTANITGEVVIEWIFDDNTTTFNLNGNSYNLGNISSFYRGLWNNNTFAISIGNWRTASSNIYVRKVEITTL